MGRFRLSCLRGKIWATGREPMSLRVAAVVIAGIILLATLGGSLLGRFGTGLRKRAPWLLVLGAVSDASGKSRPRNSPGCRCRSSRRRRRIVEVYTDDLPQTARQRFGIREASARRLRDRRGGRLPDRRVDRMVAQRRLLGASGAAVHRAAAGDGVASVRVLRVSVELERQHVPDRAGDRHFRSRC